MTDIIQFVATITGPTPQMDQLYNQFNGCVVNDVNGLLNTSKQRETFAIGEDLFFINEKGDKPAPANGRRESLWPEFNYGIHQASLQKDGFAYKIKIIADDSDDIVGFVRSLSEAHPDLFVDLMFSREDADNAAILLFHSGDVVMYSLIEGEDYHSFRRFYESIGAVMCKDSDDPLFRASIQDSAIQKNMYFLHGFC